MNIDVTRFSSKEEADILGSKPVNEVGEMRPTSLRLRTEKVSSESEQKQEATHSVAEQE